jgi:hypothetical protein
MKRLLLIATALLVAIAANAQENIRLPSERPYQADGRDMTCRGELYGQGTLLNIGVCYTPIRLENRGKPVTVDPTMSETISAACQREQPCIVRARVVRRDTPNGMPQSYTIIRVYSAQAH